MKKRFLALFIVLTMLLICESSNVFADQDDGYIYDGPKWNGTYEYNETGTNFSDYAMFVFDGKNLRVTTATENDGKNYSESFDLVYKRSFIEDSEGIFRTDSYEGYCTYNYPDQEEKVVKAALDATCVNDGYYFDIVSYMYVIEDRDGESTEIEYQHPYSEENGGVLAPSGTPEIYVPPVASTGYYITFNPANSTATVNGFASGAAISNYSVVIEGTSIPAKIISTEGGLSFEYDQDKYEIKFTVGNNDYIMHANCKTVDVQFTTDKTALDSLFVVMQDYFSKATTDIGVAGKNTKTIMTSEDALLSFVASTYTVKAALKDNSIDQTEIDILANDAIKAINDFLASLYVECYEIENNTTISAMYYPENEDGIEMVSAKYAEGLVAPGEVSTDIGAGVAYDSAKAYTLVFTTKIFDHEKTSVFYVGSTNAAIEFAKSTLNGVGKSDKLPAGFDGLTDIDQIASAYFAALNWKESGSGQNVPGGDVNPPQEKQLGDFVDITVSGDAISWEAKAGSVVIERVSFAKGDVKTSTAALYLPLEKGAKDFNALEGTDYTVRFLLRTGDTVKTFYYHTDTIASGACSEPLVQKYAGAVGVYSRGANCSYVAYAKGNYDLLGTALTDELSGNTTVYYVQDGKTLDSSAFTDGAEYTFFFGDSNHVVVNF